LRGFQKAGGAGGAGGAGEAGEAGEAFGTPVGRGGLRNVGEVFSKSCNLLQPSNPTLNTAYKTKPLEKEN